MRGNPLLLCRYEAVHKSMVDVCGRQGIDKTLQDNNLDALVTPTAGSSFPASIVRIIIQSPPVAVVCCLYRKPPFLFDVG